MADSVNGEKKESRILVEFVGPGMAEIDKASWTGVSPMQMLALAKWLEFKGMNLLAMREQEAARREVEQRRAVAQVQAMMQREPVA